MEEQIRAIFEEKGCRLISFVNKQKNITYECKCGKIMKKLYKDFIRRGCKTCNSKALKEIPPGDEYTTDEGETWKPIPGGWISSWGNAKNSLDIPLTLCPIKFRYRMCGKHQYASRLVATAFEIPNYEKLTATTWAVTHKDKNPANNRVENLEVITRKQASSDNGKKSRQSEKFCEKMNWSKDRFARIEKKIVPELPDHTIYRNGEIWNGTRFLTFSLPQSDNYFTLNTPARTYKVHRLVCYAFHPLPDKKCLADYKGLQVNHKNGITTDNHADNLEWNTSSENIAHAYRTGLNKKTKFVVQLDKDYNYINKFPSVVSASRHTGEPCHRITALAKGEKNSKAIFNWAFSDLDYYHIDKGDGYILSIPFNKVNIIVEDEEQVEEENDETGNDQDEVENEEEN